MFPFHTPRIQQKIKSQSYSGKLGLVFENVNLKKILCFKLSKMFGRVLFCQFPFIFFVGNIVSASHFQAILTEVPGLISDSDLHISQVGLKFNRPSPLSLYICLFC